MNVEKAKKLIGYTFEKGWKVLKVHERLGTSTGGVYSMCFDVERDGIRRFMKALDIDAHIRKSKGDQGVPNPIEALQNMINQHQYERTLSNICREGHVTKVAYVQEDGSEYVEVFNNTLVPYLIFEMADMDVHSKLELTDRLDFAWKMKSLHDVAVGMQQLHGVGITHQDIKPSNILLYDQQTKLGDLGCSLCDYVPSPFENDIFPGDHNYAPPERLYNLPITNVDEQKKMTDAYLLGGLTVFYLTGMSFNGLMFQYLPNSYKPECFKGDFNDVKYYLMDAFQKVLELIENSIPIKEVRERLLNDLRYLCSPIKEERGHPRNRNNIATKYSLERFISDFAYIQHLAESKLFKVY